MFTHNSWVLDNEFAFYSCMLWQQHTWPFYGRCERADHRSPRKIDDWEVPTVGDRRWRHRLDSLFRTLNSVRLSWGVHAWVIQLPLTPPPPYNLFNSVASSQISYFLVCLHLQAYALSGPNYLLITLLICSSLTFSYKHIQQIRWDITIDLCLVID